MAFAFIPPAALELGNATGFSFVITDDNNLGPLTPAAARDKLLDAATKDPRLAGVRIFGQKDVGQLHIDLDKVLAGAHGLTEADVTDTLRTAWCGASDNDFLDRGRPTRANGQTDTPYPNR